MKKLFVLFLGLMLLIMAASCSESSDAPPMNDLAEWQSYTIVRPDAADNTTVQAAVKLRKVIEETTGVALTLTTDWVKRGEEPPVGTKEILIGATNRPESTDGCAYLDYEIGFTNDRIYISGGCGTAVDQAVDWFIENCVSATTLKTPAETYTHQAEYPLANVRLGGIPLSEYTVQENLVYPDLVKQIKQELIEKTGFAPEEKGDALIVMTHDPELGMLEYAVTQEGSVVTLATSETGLEIEKAVELFFDCINNRQSDDLSINERKEIEMEQIKTASQSQLDEWRKMTDERIHTILASPNMEIPEGKVVYYVSPNGDDMNDGKSPETAWKTLSKVNSAALASGMYVCFERGGLWRGQLQAKTGVTYTAYGEGDKPQLYGSLVNGADASMWSKTETENIWVFNTTWSQDVGTLVFNHGEAHAIKCVIRTESDGSTYNNTTGEPFKTYADLTTDLHFYHDYAGSGKIYLYSVENPGERFDSIEFNIKNNVVAIKGNNVTIDNLCIKYGGAHGVGAGTVTGLTVQNCEFGWIGGSIQAEGIFGRNYGTRYGNAVEIYGGCTDFTVTDNYIYQVYDAAITQQVGLNSEVDNIKNQKNVTYARNVMEYCNYSIEYFLSGCVAENPSRMENFLIEDNYMWYAGLGFCEQRPDHDQGAHIKGWSGANRNRATNYVIKNNLMVETRDMMVQINSDLYNPDGSDSMPSLENNIFVARIDDEFGVLAMNDATRKAYAPAMIDYVSEHSNGDIFYFIEE